MILKLFLLFTLIPIAELAILIQVGKEIGAIGTIFIVFITGVAGAWLARAQGLGVIRRIREAVMVGSPPSTELLDGAFILIGGGLLVTPGIMTDFIGFFCLIPATRAILQRWMEKKFLKWFNRNAMNMKSQSRWMPPDFDGHASCEEFENRKEENVNRETEIRMVRKRSESS